MTAPRLARGSRSRFFVYFAVILVLVGLMLIYHNTLTQLDAAKKSYDVCHQQQESLSAQLQVIYEYRNRLEKSLHSEKEEHKKTKNELSQQIDNEKSKSDKNTMEANLRYTSLQQHYKLLQSQHEDLITEYNKIKKEHVLKVDSMQSKIQELQNQLKQLGSQKENLKSQFITLQSNRDKLRNDLEEARSEQQHNESEINRLTKENYQLHKLISQLKDTCRVDKPEVDQLSEYLNSAQLGHDLPSTNQAKNFGKQIGVSDGVYQIKTDSDISIKGESNPGGNLINLLLKGKNIDRKIDDVAKKEHEDENAEKNVLPQPGLESDQIKSSSPKSTTKSTLMKKTPESGKQLAANPIMMPTPNKRTSAKDIEIADTAGNVLPLPNINDKIPNKKIRKFPAGIVRVSEIAEETINEKKPVNENLDTQPNRYRNSIDSQIDNKIPGESNAQRSPIKKPKAIYDNDQRALDMAFEPNLNQENGAMEIIDPPNKENIQDDPFGLQDAHNDGFGDQLKQDDNTGSKKQHIDTLGNGGPRQLHGGIRIGAGLNYEAEDYEKDGGKAEDLQLEEEAEPEGEDDDDVDDYNNHIAARQKEPAVRN